MPNLTTGTQSYDSWTCHSYLVFNVTGSEGAVEAFIYNEADEEEEAHKKEKADKEEEADKEKEADIRRGGG